MDVAGGDKVDAVRFGQPGEGGQTVVVVALVVVGGGEVEGGVEVVAVPGEVVGEVVAGGDRGDRGNRDEDVVVGVCRPSHVLPAEMTLALGRAPASGGDEAGERAVAAPGDGEAEKAGAVDKVEPRAGNEVHSGPKRGLVGAHHARQGVAVGEREGAVAELRSPLDHLLGVGGTPQKGEVAGDLELGVGGRGERRPGTDPCPARDRGRREGGAGGGGAGGGHGP